MSFPGLWLGWDWERVKRILLCDRFGRRVNDDGCESVSGAVWTDITLNAFISVILCRRHCAFPFDWLSRQTGTTWAAKGTRAPAASSAEGWQILTVLMTLNKKLSAYCKIIKSSQRWWRWCCKCWWGLGRMIWLRTSSGWVLELHGRIPFGFNLFLFHFTRSVAFPVGLERNANGWMDGWALNGWVGIQRHTQESHRWLANEWRAGAV